MDVLAGGAGESPADNFWFEAFQKGDKRAVKEAIQTIYQCYQTQLISYAERRVRRDEAEDIFMVAVERAWERRTSFNSVKHLERFLYRVIGNACIDIFRSRRFIDDDGREKLLELEAAAADTDAPMELEKQWIKYVGWLNQQTEGLSTEERLILNEHIFEGKTLRRIAAEQNINCNTLYSTKSRLLAKLRKLMGDDWELFVFLLMAKYLLIS